MADVPERTRALVREQLKRTEIGNVIMAAAEAADISERTRIMAADALGFRTQRGQWWLPE
jgi:hypothetical protein